MRVYRIYIDREGYSALGYGPAGARWNKAYTPVIYAASAVSLAMLEHLSIRGAAVSDFKWKIAVLEVDAEPQQIDLKRLPRDWDRRPYPGSTQELGTRWALQKQSLAFAVPSARIPLNYFEQEYNVLINPFHTDFIQRIKVLFEEEIPFTINY
ncbi:RES domain-containing protein [Leeuwenhoekiella aestuarii]|uniref:RES domain-containing protein n=1 Tax=Leeuwenhoekiella aestuarii TaxID=2249426 RepID=A0A4Q0NUQ2_9FLAO|nr:RES family NAD+ phosphorylase [Leeuwenhoekiella aestuarii]RXG14323.1 RES domain-containing protein [Leeuwenhoekiella aestuarii]RXG19072.1 RES domain-containing protein [Leeuwenhoekiella aestuarii]